MVYLIIKLHLILDLSMIKGSESMDRKEIKGPISDETLNNTNHNFIELYNQYRAAGLNAEDARLKAIQAVSASELAESLAKQANITSEQTKKDLEKIIIESGTSDAEVIQARGNYPILNERLNAADSNFDKTDSKFDVRDWELNSKARQKNGICVFVSDDGRIEEWTVARDIFSEFRVPQTIGVVSDWVGRINFLNLEQLLTLQNEYGWEIASHSKSHPSNPPMIDNPDNTFVENEFSESKQALIEMGLEVNNYIYPGGNYGKRERMYSKKHYRSARQSDGGYYGGINYSPINTHELKTVWIDPSSYLLRQYLEQYPKQEAISRMIEHVKELIDTARDSNGLLIISTHFQHINDDDYKDMYRQIVVYAKSNLETKTLNDALNEMGNIVEIGDFSEQGNRAVGDNHYVVGTDGLASGSLSVAEENRFNGNTPYVYFPVGVTVVPITANNTSGLPFDGEGTLINYKPYPHEPGSDRVNYGWQEFVAYENKLPKFRRDTTSNSAFNSWYPDSTVNMARYNDFDVATEYRDLPFGITVSRVIGSNPNLNLAPEERQGTLITVKQDTFSNLSRYSYQEYQLWGVDRVYRRRVIGENEFGNWFLVNGIMTSDRNNFDTLTPQSEFFPGINYSIVSGDNPNLSDAPEGTRGLLITNKPTHPNFPVYTIQEYTPYGSNNKYHRGALSTSEWGRWKKIEGTIV